MKKSAPPTKVRTLSCSNYYNEIITCLHYIFNGLYIELNALSKAIYGGVL